MAEEDELFAEAMGKVQPLAEQNKVNPEGLKQKPRKQSLQVQQFRKGAVVPPQRAFSPEQTDDPWRLVADGVSREKLKQLAAGRPAAERTFDLHGLSRDEALNLLASGFENALSDGLRVVCIIHGRGLHSQGKAILKEATFHWLREGTYAYAVLAAVPEPGSGGGAALVLLRRQTIQT